MGLQDLSLMPISTTMRNTQGVIRNLYAKNAEIVAGIREATEDTAFFEQQLISDEAPVRTGFMRDNVEVQFTPDHLFYEVGWWAETFQAANLRFYPPYVFAGTSDESGNPVLHSAHAHVAAEYKRLVSSVIRQAANRPGARTRP